MSVRPGKNWSTCVWGIWGTKLGADWGADCWHAQNSAQTVGAVQNVVQTAGAVQNAAQTAGAAQNVADCWRSEE